MIITDKFVFVHHPKTGGTFVTRALLRIHGVDRSAVKIGEQTNRVFDSPYGQLIIRGKHNACTDIPEGLRDRTVLGLVRNPYDRYVSEYEFGWWKNAEFLAEYRRTVRDFDRRFPGFPDIRFQDYLVFQNEQDGLPGLDVGVQTIAFIQRYFRDPARVLAELTEDYFASGRYRDDMFDVHFLRTDRLNQGLHDFLLSVGYPPHEIAFILETGKVRPGMPPGGRPREDLRSWESYYTPEAKAYVRHRSRHLFTLFPEFDC